jgi:superfamily II DNA/RNA helicase
MSFFSIHRTILHEYEAYIRSFLSIKDARIRHKVEDELNSGLLWPEPLIQFNPAFKFGASVAQLCNDGILHKKLGDIFPGYNLYQHQEDAIRWGVKDKDFIVTSGTGSGKSLTYIASIFNHILTQGEGTPGVKALIIYPMNALINSQIEEFTKFKTAYELRFGSNSFPIKFAQYTGQVKGKQREEILQNPPDILLTNYVMLELLMTRSGEKLLRDAMEKQLKFLVLDELHTYRGRQGADVAMLVRRIKAMIGTPLVCIGTSATMVSEGSLIDQKKAVAKVGLDIFGSKIEPEQVIVESLERKTNYTGTLPDALELQQVLAVEISSKGTENELKENFLAVWLENAVALKETQGWLHRNKPLTLNKICALLSDQSGVELEICQLRLHELLDWSASLNEKLQEVQRTYLPYRLHQFISQTGSVYVTLETPDKREIRLEPGHFLQQQTQKVRLYQTVFSRYSGHEFLCVRLNPEKGILEPRDFRDSIDVDDSELTSGYVIIPHSQDDSIWNDDLVHVLPDAWVRESKKTGAVTVVKNYRNRIPQRIYFRTDGTYSMDKEGGTYQEGWFMPAKLLFDPTAGVFFDPKTNENTKLMRMCNEGRSTATTILSFSVIKALDRAGFAHHNQKLLSFTDNRQDAALQSGHFNDFVNVGRLRSAIYHALEKHTSLDSSEIAQAVFEALQLDQKEYAKQPSDFAGPRQENEKALKDYLTIRIIQDLERSWKFTMPNLEQCGLLQVTYKYLHELADNNKAWDEIPLFAKMTPENRHTVLDNILDYFRTAYAIDHLLISGNTYTIETRIRDTLKSPWTLSEDERLTAPNAMRIESIGNVYGQIFTKSAGRSSTLGRYLREEAKILDVDLAGHAYNDMMHSLLGLLEKAAFLKSDKIKGEFGEAKVYQLNANMIMWGIGDGTNVKADAIRIRTYKDAWQREPNPYFKKFYQQEFATLKVLLGKEHTGQIGNEDRIQREEQFRNGQISTLFCSPTMELGIDIRDLNVVHMRNAPPNPSNYAQRSGRAGRSGQGALVFTYCSQYSPHDRHYFKHSVDLVSGFVVPPKIDLSNEELIKTHINALYLRDLGLKKLERSIADVIEEQSLPDLPLDPDIQQVFTSEHVGRSQRVLDQIKKILELEGLNKHAFSDQWLREYINQIPLKFDQALDRWRTIYNSAMTLMGEAQAIIRNPIYAQRSEEKKAAFADERYASRQLYLLRCEEEYVLSEFYPYSYLAAEGFLPGYNFNRLPLRTFIPGTKGEDEGEYISRARHVAITEFAPRNIIYHNGGKFMINRMMISEIGKKLEKAKVAKPSGYFMMGIEYDLEMCPVTGVPLTNDESREHIGHLLPMTETATMRRERINCDEEERLREGFVVETYFSVPGTMSGAQPINVFSDGELLLEIFYLPAAKIVKVNKNWSRVKNHGFPIDLQTGYWKKLSDYEKQDPHTGKIEFVKLYTDMTVDALYIQPVKALNVDAQGVTTLQYAFKRAIEETYQAESNEIEVISMGRTERPNIMAYEASEGSLGVMRQIVKEKSEFAKIIQKAYEICHFKEGEDIKPEAGPASYDDLLSYYNQRDHEIIDRFKIKDALEKLLNCEVQIKSKNFSDYESQYNQLLQDMDHLSSTEHAFLIYLKKRGLRLPDKAQPKLAEELGLYIMPDFQYAEHVFVFCDGSPHDDLEIMARDKLQRRALRDRGFRVIVWYYRNPLEEVIEANKDIFTKVAQES